MIDRIDRRFLHVAGVLLIGASWLTAAPAAAQEGAAPGTAPATAADAASQEQQLPKLNTLLREAVAAMGGHELIDGIRTMRVVSKAETGDGVSIVAESVWSSEGGRLMKRTMPGSPEIVMGIDGEVAWQRNLASGGYELLDESRAEQIEEAQLHMKLLKLDRETRKEFRSMRVVGRERLGERDCWKLRLINKQGQHEHMYFDVDSSLPVAAELSDGSMSATMTFEDWQPLDGLTLFRRMTLSGKDLTMSVEFTEITINDLESDFFAAPPEVKQLVAAERERVAAARPKLEDFPPEQQKKITDILDGLRAIADLNKLQQAVNAMTMAAGLVPPEERAMFQYIATEAQGILKERQGG